MKIGDIAQKLIERFGRKCSVQLYNANVEIETLLNDSRNYFNPSDTLFFAISTPGGNDGHKYLNELYERGVRNFVCQYLPEDFKGKKDSNIIIVQNSIAALNETGSLHRARAKKTVAITGSRGKTTLKEMIFQIMEPLCNISRSPRSYNSKIGVPLSLWQISKGTDLALIEAGISQKGEMAPLAKSIGANTVIFTNIGDAHDRGFASKQEKANEKAILAFNKNVSRVIFPLDNPFFEESLKNLPDKVQKIGWSVKNPDADLFINLRQDKITGNKGIKYIWQGEENSLNVNIETEYDLENLAGALAFILSEGLSSEMVKERVENLSKVKTRMNVSEGMNGCTVILDSYTSDLNSLSPAIDFMRRRKIRGQNLSLILSDLRHEVNDEQNTYQQVAEIVKTRGISKFIGIGKSFLKYKELFPKTSLFFENTKSFLETLGASDFNNELILLKGAPAFEFEKIYRQLEAKKHETVLEVNLDAMLRNYNYFRGFIPSNTGIIAMVKASGYGAGSYEIAKTLQDAGAAYLAVAALDEGIDLRNKGIVMPIMVMNPKSANYRALFKNRLEPVIYSLPMLESLILEEEKCGLSEYPVHIKLDTGMHRMGFMENEIDILKRKLQDSNVRVASIFSHLATADCLEMDDFTRLQLERFEKTSSEIISFLGYEVKRHILNSAGIIRFPEYHYDLVRLGIGLYGANTLPAKIEKPLWPVSTLRTVIICIREVEEPETVGYARKGKVKNKRRIATLPIGYADGMNRRLGNGAIRLHVGGKEAPTIGNICMDATMIDVTDIDCREGDPVEIFGENISVESVAEILDTIPYEILTSVSPRVKRVYYRE